MAILIQCVVFRLQYADSGLSPMQDYVDKECGLNATTHWEECCMTTLERLDCMCLSFYRFALSMLWH